MVAFGDFMIFKNSINVVTILRLHELLFQMFLLVLMLTPLAVFFVLIKKIYLLVGKSFTREEETEIFICWFTSRMVAMAEVGRGIRLKPRALAIFAAFLRLLVSRELDQKWSCYDLNQCWYGMLEVQVST